MTQTDEWIDIAEAALRAERCTATIRNHIKKGSLPAVKSRATGRDGRKIEKIMIRVVDVDRVFPKFDMEAHIRKVESEWVPLSERQQQTIRRVFMEHWAEQRAKAKLEAGGTQSLPDQVGDEH